MAIRIVSALDRGAVGIELVADLDADNGEPDETRLFARTFGSFASSANPGETQAQYRARIRGEFRLLAREEAARRGAGRGADIPALIGADIS